MNPHSLTGRLQDNFGVSENCGSILQWLEKQREQSRLEVHRISFEDSREWYFMADKEYLRHCTGCFYTVEGICVEKSTSLLFPQMQPIFNQPEIGILGFLAQEREGELHLLV